MLRFSAETFTTSEIEVGLYQQITPSIIVTVQAIIDEADVDGNGLIDYAEFFTLMSPNNNRC